ncbi:MAG: hypothetical protein WCA46_01610, partial [Actinocatenispora sp.]
MRTVRVANVAFGLLMLLLPALAGPASVRLLLPTGVLTVLVGAIWQRSTYMTLAAVHVVPVTALALSTTDALAGVLLATGTAVLLTGYLLSAEALDSTWPGARNWWRRRGRAVRWMFAAVVLLAAVAAVPAGGSVPLFVVGAVALFAAVALAMPRRVPARREP